MSQTYLLFPKILRGGEATEHCLDNYFECTNACLDFFKPMSAKFDGIVKPYPRQPLKEVLTDLWEF